MRTWIVAVFAVSLTVSSPSTARADIADWFDECHLGTLLGQAYDGIFGLPWVGTGVGATIDISRAADCDGDAVSMRDFNLLEVRKRWTNGKLVVDIQRRYGFDTNGNGAVDAYTGWGDLWRWKKKSTGEYFKARYSLMADPRTPGLVKMSMNGAPWRDSGTQIPASYAAGYQGIPAGYPYLSRVEIGGSPDAKCGPCSYVVNGVRIYGMLKNVKGKSFFVNAAGKLAPDPVTVALGQVYARSVPKGSKLHQHIVYRRP